MPFAESTRSAASPLGALRVLITCRDLVIRGGAQLYTRDLAEALRDQGHTPVVFSPRLGAVAADLRSRGIAVIDDLDRLGAAPDVIHAQHHLEAMAAMLRFPAVAAIYVCHGWLPWQEAPPKFPSLVRYVAVDALRRDRLVLEHGIPEARVEIVPNFVDLDRFRPRPPLPAKPRRALLLSNQASAETFAPVVESACRSRGIALSVAGFACGQATERPEELLPDFDLVFARGRSALEALAVGCAVVLCDVEGCGPLVDGESYDRLRALNFGLGALRPPVAAELLGRQIDRYDPAEAARVRDRARAEAGRTEAVARLVGIYREAISASASSAGRPGREAENLLAASRYLSWLGPEVDLQRDLAETLAAFEDAQARAFEVEAKLWETQGRLEETAAALAILERSPAGRMRNALLGLPPVVALYRALKARRARPQE